VKEAAGSGEETSPTNVCLKAEVTHSDEASRQYVKEESPDEIRASESERFAHVVAPSVAIAKRDLAAFVSHEALVADGDAMGVAPEVAEHLGRTSHGSLAVDDPFLGGSLSEQAMPEVGSETCRVLLQRLLEEIEQLASKHIRENSHRHQKAWARGDPAIMRSVETTAGHDAMDVGVEEEGLGPGVQHSDRARRSSESSLAHGVECPDRRLEEQRVARPPVSQEERVECGWHGEDDVKVGDGEELILLCLDPACLFQVLALGAMPVPARIVEGLLAATVVAHLEVATQKWRSTRDDISNHSTTITPELLGRRRIRSENLRQIRRAARLGRHAYLGLASRRESSGLRVSFK
jgi:hypothetical protein